MFNLSLTACSFHLRKLNSKGNNKIYDLNKPLTIKDSEGIDHQFSDLSEIFVAFFNSCAKITKDDVRQQTFMCEYNSGNVVETNDFRMLYVKINSGIYGNSSEIFDGKTQRSVYKKKATDIDTRPFYLMVIFPRDNKKVTVQKGMLIFQNVGPFGVKTITTELMQEYFSREFGITLKCKTIAPDLFVRKVITKENTKKLIMIKNVQSSDMADNLSKGYGTEVRELSQLRLSGEMWAKWKDRMRYVSGKKYSLYEFEGTEYNNLKVVVDIGGRTRTIDLHNIENLSIIEGIPDEIRMVDGHPNLSKLIDHFIKVL